MNKCFEANIRFYLGEALLETKFDEADAAHIILKEAIANPSAENRKRVDELAKLLDHPAYSLYHRLPFLVGLDIYFGKGQNYPNYFEKLQTMQENTIDYLLLCYGYIDFLGKVTSDGSKEVQKLFDKTINKLMESKPLEDTLFLIIAIALLKGILPHRYIEWIENYTSDEILVQQYRDFLEIEGFIW
ncbi:MAG: hypothetical protein PHP41_02825 [Bacilli bacterium]|jgi:hypothetical protein|nr:hypothetical protein [Bacilli bacterium]MDY0063798.1 hypothetical protein [Bacilli bacterium]